MNTGITGTHEALGTNIHAAIKQHMREVYAENSDGKVDVSDPGVVEERARQMWVHVADVIIRHLTEHAYVEVVSPATDQLNVIK